MKIIFIIGFLFLSVMSFSQLEWEAKSSMPNNGRFAYASFQINGKIYCGLGSTFAGSPYLNDFWEYDPTTDIWAKKANFPGSGKFNPASFVLGGKGYVCMGYTNSHTTTTSCYSYDPTSDTWSTISAFPGAGRYSAQSFVIENNGFISCGSGGGPSSFKDDLWMYTPSSDTWSQKANFPGGKRDNALAFSIGQYGYVGAGNTTTTSTLSSFWRYNKATNSWTAIASMPQGTLVGTGFVLDGEAYVGLGKNRGGTYYSSFYKYTPSTNQWTSSISNSSNITMRAATKGLEIGNSIYLLLGEAPNKLHTGLFSLKSSDTCDFIDTLIYTTYDTIHTTIVDTLRTTIEDTMHITIVDTLRTTVEDTLNIYLYTVECGNLEFKVYPNPTSELIYLFSNNPSCFPGAKVELIDMLGQVLETKPYESLISFDIKGYARELYFIRLTSSNGATVFSKKVLLN